MRTDVERWEQRYAERNPNPEFTPDPFLTDRITDLPTRGRSLDVACGVGHNALFLAERGLESFAVDASLTGLSYGMGEARRRGVVMLGFVADLDDYPLPREHFALVLVIRFLNRRLCPALAQALQPGGVLLYRTFNRHHLHRRADFNPQFLLEPGELPYLFPELERIDSNDHPGLTEPESWLVARRS